MKSKLKTTMRTCPCGELRAANVGEDVALCGWASSSRDHGSLIFIDLRDRTGLTQIVFDPEGREGIPGSKEAHAAAETIRPEYCLRVEGTVVKRTEGMANPKLATGQIEVLARTVTVLSTSKTPPFEIEDGLTTREELRLRYRYLDLRRPEMQRTLEARHRFILAVRRHLDSLGFIEVETPFLGKSTPEGARDFLVPSRLSPGKFFALPQSPQMYKQLLMVAGTDRYFQMARCLRDEDLRADRQFEHTQIDMEMSFVSRDDVFAAAEGAIAAGFKEGAGVELERPFPRMAWAEALARCGTDKPDLRFGLEIVDVGEIAKKSSFKVFLGALEKGGVVRCLRAPGWAGPKKGNEPAGKPKSRKNMDSLTSEVSNFGARGLAYMKVQDGAIAGPIAKFFPEDAAAELLRAMDAESGDMLLFGADKETVVAKTLGFVRTRVGSELGLKKLDFKPVWVVDFPLFAWSEEDGRWTSEHHPFTAPHPDDVDKIEDDPGSVRSQSYDLVINGTECASGSVRIHDGELQKRVFRRLELTEQEIEERFGFFADAMSYGAPPHAGVAPGVDRLVALMLGLDSIREVIAFPKTQKGQDLMSGAPGPVSAAQLKELHIETKK